MSFSRKTYAAAITLALASAPALFAQTYPKGNDPRDNRLEPYCFVLAAAIDDRLAGRP